MKGIVYMKYDLRSSLPACKSKSIKKVLDNLHMVNSGLTQLLEGGSWKTSFSIPNIFFIVFIFYFADD